MELMVFGCKDCPLCNIDFGISYFCNYPNYEEEALMIDIDENEDPITPEKCPLNTYPIIIKNKEWQKLEMFWNKRN